jgi:hypothetical protein
MTSIQQTCIQLLKTQFHIPEGARFMNRSDAMIKTAFRWLRAGPTEPYEVPWTTDDTSMTIEQALDKFINRNLYMLPIPRFVETCPEVSNQLNDYEVFTMALNVIEPIAEIPENIDALQEQWTSESSLDEYQESFLTTVYELVLRYYPWISFLREKHTDLSRLVVALSLLALDPKTASTISVKSLRLAPMDSLWASLQEDIKSLDTSNLIKALALVDRELQRRRFRDLVDMVQRADTSWSSVANWTIQEFVTDAMIQELEAQIRSIADLTNFSLEYLKKHAYVRNYVDETIDLGFIFDKKIN